MKKALGLADAVLAKVEDGGRQNGVLFEVPIGGTAFTIEEAGRRGKPLREVYLKAAPEVEETRAWMAREDIRTLNVAGPRESEAPGIYEEARSFLEALLCGSEEA